eukprot:GHVP01063598.1.p1 GENE.GHVP01063598.1~~GHVP01063598.1.p1  ORF type:complete len:570 (+),score=89.14 GHVP01063598.1:36-1745(+)
MTGAVEFSIFVQRKVKAKAGDKSIHQILLLRLKENHPTLPLSWSSIQATYPEKSTKSPVQSASAVIREETGLDVAFVRDSLSTLNKKSISTAKHSLLFRVLTSKQVVLEENSIYSTPIWISPESIIAAVSDLLKNNQTCVPGLASQLAKVYLPVQFEDFVEWIGKKRTQGAAEVANLTLHGFEKIAQEMISSSNLIVNTLPPRVFLNFLDSAVGHVGNCRPSIAPLRNLAQYLQKRIRLMPSDTDILLSEITPASKKLQTEEELLKNNVLTLLLTEVSTYQLWRSDAFLKLVGHVHTLLNGVSSIYTMSRSSVIETAIVDSAKRRAAEERPPLQVTMAESRPLLEGVLLASQCLTHSPKEGLNVILVTDAQAALFAQKCDCVLVGADAVFPDGSCVNKVGGLGAYYAAFNCHPKRRPVYVACTSDKFLSAEQLADLRSQHVFHNPCSNEPGFLDSNESSPLGSSESPTAQDELEDLIGSMFLSDSDPRAPIGFKLEEKEADEVYSREHTNKETNTPVMTVLDSPNAIVRNVYFEYIPASLVTAYITEEGIVSPSDVHSVFLKRAKSLPE